MDFARSIFVTGFPGFIAQRLVAKLARADTQMFLLVESRFVDQATATVERIAADHNIPLENFALIEGDITKPSLGMSAEDLDAVRAETTDIFHLAAAYDLAIDRETALRVNLEGTRNVNAFAASVPELRRYNYISTCYVAGKRTGTILEAELEHDRGFRNFYEETKYLAELDVEQLKETVPVTIYRPSVVVGDSKTGETAKYDGIYYLIHYLRRLPALLRFVNVGNRDVRLNLVPVDFVVEAIAALSEDPAAVGKTLAIADPNPLTTAQLFDEIAKGMAGKASIWTPPPRLVEWMLLRPFSPPLTGLPLFGVPYFFLRQEYDVSDAVTLLRKHGIACPRFQSYVRALIKFVEKRPTLD
jgi:nucleoside-diphosphate-sugar epimerase